MKVKAFIDGLRQGIASVACVSPSYRALFLHQVNILWLLVWWLLYASLCMVKHLACSLVAAAQDLLRQPVTCVEIGWGSDAPYGRRTCRAFQSWKSGWIHHARACPGECVSIHDIHVTVPGFRVVVICSSFKKKNAENFSMYELFLRSLSVHIF